MGLTEASMHIVSQPKSSQEPLCSTFFNAFLRRQGNGETLGDATQQVAAGNLQRRLSLQHTEALEREHTGYEEEPQSSGEPSLGFKSES